MSRSKKKKKKGLVVILILFILIIICVAAVYFAYNYVMHYNDVCNPNDTQVYDFTIESGMTGERIANSLEEKGIISSAQLFRLRARLDGQDILFQAGDFKLSPSMSTEEIYKALQNAKRETVSFTIPEGYTLKQIGEKLCKDGLISSETDFYAACEDAYEYDFLPDASKCVADPTNTLNNVANRLEGYLYPNTYEVYKGATAHDIIDKMLQGFANTYTDDLRNATKQQGKTMQEIIIIASMIERETLADSERNLVASVIYNRLNIGMKLQIDACIQYCLGEHKDRVLYKDLEIDSPYNTYKVNGLPAGPICSPSKASIEAALNPAETDYIYYVLKPDNSGEHNFAKNSKEFENYKKQYINSL